MSTTEFISSLVESLAWPAALVMVLLLFRSQLTTLLSTGVRRVRAGPFEVEWDRQLSIVEVELDQPGMALRSSGHGTLREELTTVAAAAPTAAVMEASARIERALHEKLISAGFDAGELRTGATGLARLAEREGLTTPETLRAIEGLSVLRNLAAHGHGHNVTTERALEFLTLAEAVLYALGTPPSEGDAPAVGAPR